MNHLEPEEIGPQIGGGALRDVSELGRWLYGNEPRSFRYAPSLIVRSEAELFGISAPRFAVRAAFDNDHHHSFVNLRRLEQLFHKVCAVHREIPPQRLHEVLFESGVGTCLADSLLKLPPALEQSYYALECGLGEAYGEGPFVRGTPFLRHVPLCGGACSQAVCFMVLALYEERASAIHGVAGITISNAGGLNPVPLKGMALTEVHDTLGALGLNCCWESIPNTAASPQLARAVLRSCIRSNVAVILPVESKRWADALQRLRKPDRLPMDLEAETSETPETNEMHAVLVVGCHKHDAERYLVNDTASYPFIRVTADCLRECNAALPDPSTGLAITVLPKGVTLPLLGVRGLPGLAWFAPAVGYVMSRVPPFVAAAIARSEPQFRLVHFDGWTSVRKALTEAAGDFSAEFGSFVADEDVWTGLAAIHMPRGWLWCQWTSANDVHSVSFWSAQPPRHPFRDNPHDWLVASFVQDFRQPWTQACP